MANVYLAEISFCKEKVAVKYYGLICKDPQTTNAFKEALSTSELSHPHIVSILDVGTEGRSLIIW